MCVYIHVCACACMYIYVRGQVQVWFLRCHLPFLRWDFDRLDKPAGWSAVPKDLPVSAPLHPAQGFTSMYHHAQLFPMGSVDGIQILRQALLHSERLSMDTALSTAWRHRRCSKWIHEVSSLITFTVKSKHACGVLTPPRSHQTYMFFPCVI